MSSLFRSAFSAAPTTAVNESRYGHDTGMVLIAMESAEELYEIFCEGTLAAEEAELDAVSEGYVLEGSQFEIVQENAIKTGIAKIKEFFNKLWAKLKAFFKQVRRYLDGIFMSGKDFVTKYEKELKAAAQNAKDFEYSMYKYDNAKIDEEFDPSLMDQLVDVVDKEVSSLLKVIGGAQFDITDKQQEVPAMPKDKFDKLKKTLESMVDDARKDMCNGATEDEEISKALFKYFRNGAEDETDKEDAPWSDEYITILKSARSVAKIDNYASKVDAAIRKAIRLIDKTETEVGKIKSSNTEGVRQLTEILRVLSSSYSKVQSFANSNITALKQAVKDRDKDYKGCALALLRHKNK